MPQFEKSTITIKTAAVVIFGLLTSTVTIVGTYWASGNAIENKYLKLESRLDLEVQARANGDEKLEMKITAGLEKVNNRMDALKPSTVTTYR